MRDRKTELVALDIQLIGVGTREDYQARALIEDGIGVDLLLDPQDQLRAALGEHSSFAKRQLLDPRGAVAYAKALGQRKHHDPIWSLLTQRPGIVLLNAEGSPVWSRMGNRLGDYPTADEVLIAARSALA